MKLPDKIQEYIRGHKLQKRWHRIMVALAMVVVVATAAVMILPAVTMEKGSGMLECKIDLHTHTDSCYDGEGNLICGYADFVVHTHNSSCYDAEGNLICPLPEIKAHTHDASCYQNVPVLVCGLEESAGHMHDESCYQVAAEPSCGMEVSETQEQEGGHVHTEECYEKVLVCGEEESEGHVHTDDCYEMRQELICSQEEIILHTHDTSCFDESGNLICGMLEIREHVHDETCLPAAAVKPMLMSQGSGESIDFTDMITSITMQVQQGDHWVDVTQGGTVEEGSNVQVRIEFKVPAGMLSSEDRTIHYQLPDGIWLSEPESGEVDYTDGNPAGSYTIGTDGYIRIDFDESFSVENEFNGYLQFHGSVALLEGEGSQIIDFGGQGGTVTIVPGEKETDLSVAKTGTYDSQTNKIAYTITVSSENGTSGNPVNVYDAFQHGVDYGSILYDTGSLVIKKGSQTLSSSEYSVTWNQQNETTPGSYAITNLPALNPGESYTITYTATPDPENSGDSTGYLEFTNKALARSGDFLVEATAKVIVSQAVISKQVVKYDQYTNSITWKLYVRNPDGRDLNGETLQDIMTFWPVGADGITWHSPPTDVTVEIGVYDYRDVNFNHQLKTITLENQRFPITFPKGSTDSYTLTYTTQLPEELAGQKGYFNNWAMFLGYEVNVGTYFEMPDVGDYGIVKQIWGNEKGQTADGKEATILKWGSVVTYPQGATKESVIYVDWIGDAVTSDGTVLPGRHYTTANILYEKWVHVVSYDWSIKNLYYGTDYSIYVLPSSATPEMTAETFTNTDFNSLSQLGWVEPSALLNSGRGDEPISMISVVLTDSGLQKLKGMPMTIQYYTILETENLTDISGITAYNFARIPSNWSKATYEEKFLDKLDKQVSFVGPNISTGDVSSYEDAPEGVIGQDGLIYYRILISDFVNETGGTTVTDILPEGAKLVDGSVYLVKHDQYAETVVAGKFTQDKYYIQYSTTAGEDGTTVLTFSLSHLKDLTDADVLGIYYAVSVADDPVWASQTSKDYVNTATWGTETDSTTTRVTHELPVLKKTGEQLPLEENNDEVVLRYYILINPEGEKLLEDAGGKLKLTDTLTIPEGAAAQLLLETAKVYRYDQAAEHGLGQPLDESAYTILYDSETRVLTVELPDSTACVVVYDYQINRSESAHVELSINNHATLQGYATTGSDFNIVVKEQSSSAGVNTANLIVYKVNSENYSELLNGALFSLERYEEADDGVYKWQETSITAKDPSGYFITGGDGPDGEIILNFLSGEGQSRYNVLYRMREVEAPKGYQITDNNYHYFVWMEEDKTKEDTIEVMGDAFTDAGVKLEDVDFIQYNANHSLYIPNEPMTTSVRVEKQWKNAMGETLTEGLPESITLTLYQHSNGTKAQYGEPVIIQSNEYGEWSYTWTELPKKAADGRGDYTYTVQETPVSGFEPTYTYPAGNNEETGIISGTIRIINTKTTNYVLPETGGSGPALVTASGVLLAGASGAGYLYFRRRRRKGGNVS